MLTLLKPKSHVPPMWAYLCGAVPQVVGRPSGHWLGPDPRVILAGPSSARSGMSQACQRTGATARRCHQRATPPVSRRAAFPAGGTCGSRIPHVGGRSLHRLSLGSFGLGASWSPARRPGPISGGTGSTETVVGLVGAGPCGLSYESHALVSPAPPFLAAARAVHGPSSSSPCLYGDRRSTGCMTAHDFKALGRRPADGA